MMLKKLIPMAYRQKIYDSMTLWCAKDNRPFNIIDGNGFKRMIETIIQVVAKLGVVDVNEIVPCKETLRNHFKSLFEELRTNLIKYLSSIDYINCTTDHWRETMSGASYMTVCIHYFEEQSKSLRSRIIATFEVGDKCALTTSNHFHDQLRQLNLESKLRIVVTDRATSMIAAFQSVKWLSCAAHNMNLLQKYSFNQQQNKDTPDPFPSITKLISASKSLVARVKKGNYNFDLICRLKQEVDTRWDSAYDMLDSISKNHQILVNEPSMRGFINDIAAGLLQEILEIHKTYQRFANYPVFRHEYNVEFSYSYIS